MQQIDMTADDLVSALLGLAETERVCLLDSCGVNHLGSHLLIAGIDPAETFEISNKDAGETLSIFEDKLASGLAAIFTISYDFGPQLLGLTPVNDSAKSEPDIFLSLFDTLIIHDYDSGIGHVVGNSDKYDRVLCQLRSASRFKLKSDLPLEPVQVSSNYSKGEYLIAIDEIKELIRSGYTYQTNLTQQLSGKLSDDHSPESIFAHLRRHHPAPFAAFIQRHESTVVSASPERFFRVEDRKHVSTSPIKGTRPRGRSMREDEALRTELVKSEKDRAENTMIVDLLRNDLGRVCEYGSINVDKLCELEEHPTLFHLVSTINGTLRDKTPISAVLKALFPCGSITGAPKISTMKIIDSLETRERGLSMGAIGYYLPPDAFGMPETFDTSVAIRTMVIRDQTVTFNVGGGIVIDSDPEKEYEESLTKAKALLAAIGGRLK